MCRIHSEKSDVIKRRKENGGVKDLKVGVTKKLRVKTRENGGWNKGGQIACKNNETTDSYISS